MLKTLVLAALAGATPVVAPACPTFGGTDFARIGNSEVIVEGVVKSYTPGSSASEYVFNVSVISTIKGPKRKNWRVETAIIGISPEQWVSDKRIYVGFQLLEGSEDKGQLGGSPCRPLGIVDATPSNLAKIKTRVIEEGSF